MKRRKRDTEEHRPGKADPEQDLPVDAGQEEMEPSEPQEATIRTLEAKVEELTDQWLRAVAELDNFRKRAAKERRKEIFLAQAGTLRPFLDVVDDFERALSQGEAENGDVMRGVRMIYEKFQHTLESLGVEPFTAVGETFDPTCMEALTTLSVPGRPENEVVGEIRKGYRFRDEIVRTAQVTVNQPAAEESAETK
jgi:molecular chaperone GrpE